MRAGSDNKYCLLGLVIGMSTIEPLNEEQLESKSGASSSQATVKAVEKRRRREMTKQPPTIVARKAASALALSRKQATAVGNPLHTFVSILKAMSRNGTVRSPSD